MMLQGIGVQGAPPAQSPLLCARSAGGGAPVVRRRVGRNPRSLLHPIPETAPGQKKLCSRWQGRRTSKIRTLIPENPLLPSPSISFNRSVIARHSSHNGGLHADGHAEKGHHSHDDHEHGHDEDAKCEAQGNLHSHESEHGHEHHDHDHDHEGHHHEHGHSHHGHTHASFSSNLNGIQKSVLKVCNVLGLGFLADMWRDNLKVCLTSLALLLLGAAAPYVVPKSVGATVQSALVLPALPLTGVPAVMDAAIDVAGGRVNIHVLMAVAAFASVFMGNALEGGLLLAMFSLSHQAEDFFIEKAMGDVKALKESNPEFALVLEPFDVSSPPPFSAMVHKKMPVHHVEIGSFVFVQAGETVPVDGEVYQGRAMVSVEHLTGEAQPIEKGVGSDVPGGARSIDGVIIIKATKKWKDSTVARIMKLTEEAQLNRPVLQRWLDEFGERYSKAVVAMSVAVALLGPLLFKWPFFSSPGVRGSIYRALGLMVAASPCALAVAPLAYATAISACANKGILLKGGEALDALARCDTVAFDKTGTLTTGDLTCKAIEPLYGHFQQPRDSTDDTCCTPDCEVAALAVAAAMERGATHPIARAVVEHSEKRKLPGVVVANFHAIPGAGLAASVIEAESGATSPTQALLGSVEYIASSSQYSESNIREAAKASSYGSELIQAALSVNNKVTLFHFEDKLRVHAADVIQSLKVKTGLRLLMLTGDHAASAQRVAKAVGIEEVYYELKPEDKLHKVKDLSRKRDKSSGGLIMVGDGINDAPALAAASVGIVLAKRASATAVAVADVLLLQDALDGVFFVVAKARQTDALVKQSVALALSCIFLASLPSILGVLPLWLTVLLHEGGTLLVCVNSARAFHDPTSSWAWRQALSKLVNRSLSTLAHLLKRKDSPPAIQTAPAVAS
ncbi:unnamed protein product [Calypogeia fissa]